MTPEQIIRGLRESGKVQRCHTLPHHGSYSVAEHCWQALMLLQQLHPNPSRNLIWAVMFHDSAERWMGDQPSPVGWANPGLKAEQAALEERALIKLGVGFQIHLTDEDNQWLSAIDKLELYLWCLDQEALGNQNVKNCKQSIALRLLDESVPAPVRDFVHNYNWDRTDEQL